VLEHVWDISGTVSEWRRVIHQGGKLVLTLPDRRHNEYDHRVEPTDPETTVARPAEMWGGAHRDHLRRILGQRLGLTGAELEARVDEVFARRLCPHVNFWTCEEFLSLAARHPAFGGLSLFRWWHHPRAFEFGVILERCDSADWHHGTWNPRWARVTTTVGTLFHLVWRKAVR
jgi:hypothetical protein